LPRNLTTDRLNALAREHPEGIGGWFTYEGDSSERHEFRPDED